MKRIVKRAEPPSLTAHRQQPLCDYDNYADKDALRTALITEQRGICCYCMGRIHNDPLRMKVEHWRCQSHHADQQLDFQNMLGACLGGQGQPPDLQHCDTRKQNQDLRWNPADPAHHIETRVRFEMDGSVRSNDQAFDTQFDAVLNLNIKFLKNNRKAIWDAIISWWQAEKARIGGPVPRARFESERNRYAAGVGELAPFAHVAVWWLEQRLARMPA